MFSPTTLAHTRQVTRCFAQFAALNPGALHSLLQKYVLLGMRFHNILVSSALKIFSRAVFCISNCFHYAEVSAMTLSTETVSPTVLTLMAEWLWQWKMVLPSSGIHHKLCIATGATPPRYFVNNVKIRTYSHGQGNPGFVS